MMVDGTQMVILYYKNIKEHQRHHQYIDCNYGIYWGFWYLIIIIYILIYKGILYLVKDILKRDFPLIMCQPG